MQWIKVWTITNGTGQWVAVYLVFPILSSKICFHAKSSTDILVVAELSSYVAIAVHVEHTYV